MSDTTPNPTAGSLPVPPINHVCSTQMQDEVETLLAMTLRLGACTLIGGPIGIGKTTAIATAARSLDSQPVYINMFGTNTTRDQMDTIWTAMTGTKGVGTAQAIRDQILETLQRKQMTLLIDDAHHVGYSALTCILSIYDRYYSSRGRGTPIVLVGNDLETELRRRLPELLGRAGLRREFAPIAGKPLVEFILAMQPRIAGTNPATIRDIDNRHFRGDLRRWRQFFEVLDMVRTKPGPDPLTDDEVNTVLTLIPKSTR